VGVSERLGDEIDQPPLIGVLEPRRHLIQGDPGDFHNLTVRVGQLLALRLQQVVVNGLVHASVLGHEPEIDGAEAGDDPTGDPGLLADLPHGSLLGGLPRLDMTLGQGPHQSAAPIPAGDQGRLGPPTTPIEHESARGGLLRGLGPSSPSPRRGRRGRIGHTVRINRDPWASTLPAVAPQPEAGSASQRAAAHLAPVAGLLADLGTLFADAGHELALVGGPVRDALMGRDDGRTATDLDFTTDAHPLTVQGLLNGFAETTWDIGIRFGTIGALVRGQEVEITTYRAESYDPESRKPDVEFGATLSGDLGRRDFTINAMALRLPDLELIDLYEGQADLALGLLRTPGRAVDSFSDDPLRMMRAARFSAQFGFAVTPDVLEAMHSQAERLSIVSAERIREELMKIVMSPDPRQGLTLLVDTGLAQYVIPELPLLRLEEDEHHHHKDVYEHTLTVLEQAMTLEDVHAPTTGPDPVLRLAALLHDVGKPRTRKFESDGRVSFHHHEVVGARMTRKRMQALRFSNEMIDDVSNLVELHLRFHGYGTGEWTDSAVRRYVRDAGPLLDRLHKLTRADCTTRNRRRAATLQRAYDSLEARITALAAEEELASIRPGLDGRQIMDILEIAPGPVVGEAYQFLLDLRLDRGPMSEDMATQALRAWWAARPAGS